MPARYLPLLLENVERTDPHHADPLLPDQPIQELHPVFHGCYDWHSAVHSHWSIARLGQGEALRSRLTPDAVAGEVATLQAPEAFEVPYGLAWLLTLDVELPPELRRALAPLTELSRTRLLQWTDSSIDESGLHRQTAFSAWLALRWARITRDQTLADAIERMATEAWSDAAAQSLVGEAGPTDFLSPALCTAALMVEVVDDPDVWLGRFLPALADEMAQVEPAVNPNPTDGHATHLDGLNLSRAWAANRLAGVADTSDFAWRHAELGLAASTSTHFAGSHWLPTFAVMLLTDLSMPPAGYARRP